MATDTKEPLKRAEIRTMKKDIKRLKEIGITIKRPEEIPTALQIQKKIETVRPKIEAGKDSQMGEKSQPLTGQFSKPLSEQSKIPATEDKPKEPNNILKSGPIKKEESRSQFSQESLTPIRPTPINAPIKKTEIPINKKIQVSDIKNQNHIELEKQKERSYLEEIPPDVKEESETFTKIKEKPKPQKNQESPIESGQKKKFMEEIEQWASSHNS